MLQTLIFMKSKLFIYIILNCFLFASCVKKEDEIIKDLPNTKKEIVIINQDILDGSYRGKIFIDRIVWTGTTQKPDTSYSYPLNFIIKGNQFSRAECGLSGYIEINKEKEIVEFKTKETGTTNFRNWIIDTFNYKIESGVITIFKKDSQPTNEFLASKYGIGSQFNIVSILANDSLLPK